MKRQDTMSNCNFDAIIADIENADLKTREGRATLEARVRGTYPIRDIILAADFLRGGIFISSPEPSAASLLRKVAHGEKTEIGWTRASAGIITETPEEDRELSRLWTGLVRSIYLYVGAASALGMHNSRLLAGYAFADEGDGPTLYDYTLDALVRAVPKEYRKQLDTASRLDDMKKDTQATRQGVGVLVQHLPDAKKPTVISWGEAIVITKKKGGDMTERTVRNWIKAGKASKTGTPISWDDLRTTTTWSAWVDTYLAALKSRASVRKFISERAGAVEAEKTRRRSPSA